MQQKLFQFFLPQEAGTFGNKIRAKLKKNIYIIYLQGIFVLSAFKSK